MATEWTVERVKAELPDVAISVANEPRVMGQTAGRKNQFCSVFPFGRTHGSYDFAWQTVADSLNRDMALLV